MNRIHVTRGRGGLGFMKAAASLLFALLVWPAFPAEGCARIAQVSYGRAEQSDLTMDVFEPDRPNRIGLVYAASGGWTSTANMMSPGFIQAFLTRGYTVFAAMHGSQPRYKLPEVLSQMQTAVRFVRAHAAECKIGPNDFL